MIAPPPLVPAIPRSRGTIHLSVGVLSALLATAPALHVVAEAGSPTPQPAPFHLGFSSSTFGEVNENDALAAVKIWSKVLAADERLPLDPQSRVFSTTSEIATALRAKDLDAINLATDEYLILREQLASDHCILGIQSQGVTDEYVLLVRSDGPIAGLRDLRGRSLALLEGPRMRLAKIWLETCFLEAKLGRTDGFCGRVTAFNKLTRVVLPVFFRQTDACVVTRRGFETMVELNPQVGRELRVLIVSPPVVPSLLAFRADYTSPVLERVLALLKGWHTTVAGRQILTIFQYDRVEDYPLSVMADTLKLLENHARLCTEANATETARPRTPPPTMPQP